VDRSQYETAFAATVSPPLIVANRPLLARAVRTAANESGRPSRSGLGSGIGGIGAGAPAISAGMGQATFVGVMSVPPPGPEERRRQALGHAVDDAGWRTRPDARAPV
jgi:hypothetical protein